MRRVWGGGQKGGGGGLCTLHLERQTSPFFFWCGTECGCSAVSSLIIPYNKRVPLKARYY